MVLVVNVASQSRLTPTEDPYVLWNVEKFFVAGDGRMAGRCAPDVPPDHPALRAAVDAALAGAP